MFKRPSVSGAAPVQLIRHLSRSATASIALLASVGTVSAQNLSADTVTANDAPSRWGHNSCTASLGELSDGSIANPGVCYLPPVDPDFRMTFSFSPSNDQFMTGISIWANAGDDMSDNELRRLDVEVDYFDPATNSTQTLSLDNVNIGDTTSFDDPKFVAFGDAFGLYRVSEVRIDDLEGLSATGRVVFRELQGNVVARTIAPEIAVSSSETGTVADGGSDPQGTELARAAKTLTYTISNTGTDILALDGTPTVSGEANLAGAVVVGAPGALSLAPGETTTFDVTYTPAAGGPFGFLLEVPSNDADEGTYEIGVSGTANDAPGVALTSSPIAPGNRFLVTATFSEAVNGMAEGDFELTNAVAAGFTSLSPETYTIELTPTNPLLPIGVRVRADAVTDADGAPNGVSDTLSITFVAAATAPQIDEIEAIIAEETVRDLRNAVAFNQRAVRDARARHARYLRCRDLERDPDTTLTEDDPESCDDLVGRGSAPTISVDIAANDDGITGRGSFFKQSSSHGGAQRRIVTGEFSFNRYADGDTSARFDGRVALERQVFDDTLLGVFVGANATISDIDDSFSGTRTGVGVNAGAYFVNRIANNLFVDGFVSAGLGRNDLNLSNGTLEVNGSYDTGSLVAGLAVTGRHAFEHFDVHPEFSVAYAIASVGDTGLVFSSAFGDTTETVSVGTVALGQVRFRPEFVFQGEEISGGALDGTLSIAPSLLCESTRIGTTATECGGGLEMEWTSTSRDGLSSVTARASREIIGGNTRDQLNVAFERRF